MIPLRLRKRRDGSLCLTDALGRTGDVKDNDGLAMRDDREFPADHWFTYEWLAKAGSSVSMSGNEIKLSLANASATYTIDERLPDMVHGVLDDFSAFDAPPIDEDAAAALAAARDVVDAAGAVKGATKEGAIPGRVVVRDDAGDEIALKES